jgi:hypothetical protein
MGSRARTQGVRYILAQRPASISKSGCALAVRVRINPIMTKTALVSWRDILTLLVLAVVLAAAVAFGLWLAALLTQ